MSKDAAPKDASSPAREAAVQVVVRLRPVPGAPSDDFTINPAEKTIRVRNPQRKDTVVNNMAETYTFTLNGST